jgi:nucleoside 2-deoxyribosyltransferase
VHIYIAGPIFNPSQLKVIENIKSVIKLHGHTYFSPYEASRPIWNGRAPKDCTPEERQAVVNGNIRSLHECDVLVAWVGGQQSERESADTGTVWEMGYYKALHIMRAPGNTYLSGEFAPRVTIAYVDPRDVRQNMNLMLAETVDAACRGMAQLSIALDMLKRDTLEMRERFAPSKLILQEKEPIG